MRCCVASGSCIWGGKVSNTPNGFQVPGHPTHHPPIERISKGGPRLLQLMPGCTMRFETKLCQTMAQSLRRQSNLLFGLFPILP